MSRLLLLLPVLLGVGALVAEAWWSFGPGAAGSVLAGVSVGFGAGVLVGYPLGELVGRMLGRLGG